MKEKELVEFYRNTFKKDFYVYNEFEGIFSHWKQENKVFLDIGLFPREHTIASGFPKYFIGIEVKCINLNNTDWIADKKYANAIHQCFDYKYSKFGKNMTEPAVVLLATNLEYENEKLNFKHEDYKNFVSQTSTIRQFALHHNVGRLSCKNGIISFHLSGVFWDSQNGFRKSSSLNLYVGNRVVKNKYKKPLKPFEH